MSKTTVFVREATGLTKTANLLDLISLNLSNMSIGAGLASIPFFTVALPSVSGVNLVYGTIIAFVLFLPQMIIYTMMSRRISRTGGDYVWITRTFGGIVGGPLAFTAFIANTLTFLALIVLTTVFAIGSVGLSLGNSSFLGLALPGTISGSNPTSQFVVGALTFAALIGLNIVRPKWGFKVVSAFVLIGIFGTVLAIAELLLAGQGGVVSYMNFLNSTNLGSDVTYATVANSFSGSNFNFAATVSILPFFAVFAFPFINASPAVGSEIKGKNSLRLSVPISGLIVLILMTSGFATLYYVGGFNFIQGAFSNPALVYNGFNFWTLAMGVSNNQVIAAIIGLGWILWNVAILGFGIIFFARYLFAQSFDRILPSRFAYISPKYSSPIVAHLLDLVITVAVVGGAAFVYGTFQSLFSTAVASIVYFIFIGATAAVWGAKHEVGSARFVLVVFGILSAAVFVLSAYLFLASPTVWGGNTLSYGYVVGGFILGLVIYLASSSYHKSKGIDLSLAFKELPPE